LTSARCSGIAILTSNPPSRPTALSAARDATGKAKRYPTADIIWLPVIPNPDKILCIGLNYETHRKETGRTEVENPTVFGPICQQPDRASRQHHPTKALARSRLRGRTRGHHRKSRDGISPAPMRGATLPAMPVTTKAACVISNVIRISSRRARIFQEPALSVPG